MYAGSTRSRKSRSHRSDSKIRHLPRRELEDLPATVPPTGGEPPPLPTYHALKMLLEVLCSVQDADDIDASLDLAEEYYVRPGKVTVIALSDFIARPPS